MATPPSPPGDLPPEDPFLRHLKLIQEVINHASRRYHFRREEAEEFCSSTMVKLIEDDYRILREHKGRSSLKTYLTVVIQRLLLDYLNRIWGKWRPCEEAKRLGPLAIQLDRMLSRDEFTFDEACNQLQRNHGVTASWQELQALAARLPPRAQRHLEGEEELQNVPAREPAPDERVWNSDLEPTRRRVAACLFRAVKSLPGEDQLLLKQLLEADFSISDLARAHGYNQKALYRRRDKIYAALGEALKREGVRREDIKEILGSLDFKLFSRREETG